jgi:hypothetical protein
MFLLSRFISLNQMNLFSINALCTALSVKNRGFYWNNEVALISIIEEISRFSPHTALLE